jgi:AcrR family transcriptional regulator
VSSPASTADLDENARRRRCLRAAEELFKRVGFRAVTMELVAREANVAKATLYSYFKNKDELFIAVSARMAQILLNAVQQALANPAASLQERLTDAVLAKQRLIFTLVRGSPHAAELFSYTHALAGDVFAELDNEVLLRLSETLATDPRLAPNAGQLGRALYFGSADLCRRCETWDAAEQELRHFIAVHLAGALALAL